MKVFRIYKRWDTRTATYHYYLYWGSRLYADGDKDWADRNAKHLQIKIQADGEVMT